ncbi:D-Ala-D-Ala carboxypeptidase family metallohydrolase [Pseudohaliea sp.]|uniref:D-Ala-D-Ala carboxypeptidase family metallohydrolase n=1 Tax=Pseudohaliea sp. TaxID=2740289 RepID=UPI0032EB54CB
MKALLFGLLLLLPAATWAWDDGRLSMPLRVNGLTIPYPVFSIFIMPGSNILVEFDNSAQRPLLRQDGAALEPGDGPLVAPAVHGHSVLEVENRETGEIARLKVFTLLPATRVDASGILNGYRIGAYPVTPLRGEAIYLPPEGFVELTQELAELQLSPNFRLGQFAAKQASDYPKYLVLRASLLLKLENILRALNAAGHRTPRLEIMSGYRTPFYNKAIGNVAYSRHLWGGAADLYIDVDPEDGIMDDLNGDGVFDRADAQWLAEFINGMSQRGAFGRRIGGLGVYGGNSAHGPFVHVDVRGTRARWCPGGVSSEAALSFAAL